MFSGFYVILYYSIQWEVFHVLFYRWIRTHIADRAKKYGEDWNAGFCGPEQNIRCWWQKPEEMPAVLQRSFQKLQRAADNCNCRRGWNGEWGDQRAFFQQQDYSRLHSYGNGQWFIQRLKLPRSPYRCLKRIMNPRQFVELDYGILSYELEEPVHRRFAVSSGIGLDGAVCHNIWLWAEKLGGLLEALDGCFISLWG